MKKIFLLALFLLAGTLAGNAQSTVCPPDVVCISREAALKALEDADAVKALKLQIANLEQAFADQKKLTEEANRNFIYERGINTELRQEKVSDRAIIELLLKNTKKRCLPFSVCIG